MDGINEWQIAWCRYNLPCLKTDSKPKSSLAYLGRYLLVSPQLNNYLWPYCQKLHSSPSPHSHVHSSVISVLSFSTKEGKPPTKQTNKTNRNNTANLWQCTWIGGWIPKFNFFDIAICGKSLPWSSNLALWNGFFHLKKVFPICLTYCCIKWRNARQKKVCLHTKHTPHAYLYWEREKYFIYVCIIWHFQHFM